MSHAKRICFHELGDFILFLCFFSYEMIVLNITRLKHITQIMANLHITGFHYKFIVFGARDEN